MLDQLYKKDTLSGAEGQRSFDIDRKVSMTPHAKDVNEILN